MGWLRRPVGKTVVGHTHHTGVDSLPCNALRGITPESTCQPQESNLNKVTVSKNRLTVSFLG